MVNVPKDNTNTYVNRYELFNIIKIAAHMCPWRKVWEWAEPIVSPMVTVRE